MAEQDPYEAIQNIVECRVAAAAESGLRDGKRETYRVIVLLGFPSAVAELGPYVRANGGAEVARRARPQLEALMKRGQRVVRLEFPDLLTDDGSVLTIPADRDFVY